MDITFCRLDKKFRLVIPLLARNRLGIGDLVRIRVENDKITVTRAEASDSAGSRPVSKNQKEVDLDETNI